MVETKTVNSGILGFEVETGEVDGNTNYVEVRTSVTVKLVGIEAEQVINMCEKEYYPTRTGAERVDRDAKTVSSLIRKVYCSISKGWERGVLETYYPAANARIKYEIEDLHK